MIKEDPSTDSPTKKLSPRINIPIKRPEEKETFLEVDDLKGARGSTPQDSKIISRTMIIGRYRPLKCRNTRSRAVFVITAESNRYLVGDFSMETRHCFEGVFQKRKIRIKCVRSNELAVSDQVEAWNDRNEINKRVVARIIKYENDSTHLNLWFPLDRRLCLNFARV